MKAPILCIAIDASQFSVLGRGASSGRLLTDIVGDLYNVKSFGALGDGMTDDAPAIRAALAASAGKALLFPSGTYSLNSFGAAHGAMDFVAALPSNIRIVGEPGAKLKLANGVVGSSTKAWRGNLFLADTQSNITIENLEVDFNGANNLVTVLPWTCYGLYAVNTSGIVIKGCYWHDTPGKNYIVTLGVAGDPYTPSATGLTIEDCEFKNGATSLVGNTMADDFSAIYSTNLDAIVTRCHIHHDAQPFTYCGGVEMHAQGALLSECLIESSYPAVYLGGAPVTMTDVQVINNKFLNCHSGIVFPVTQSGWGDYARVNIIGNTITLLHFTALNSSFLCQGIVESVPSVNGEGVDWTDYPFTLQYANIIGNTIQSLNGTEADLLTQGVILSSTFMVSVLGNQFYNLSGGPLVVFGSPHGTKHIKFSDNVCIDFGNESNAAIPRAGVYMLLGGSSSIPLAAAYSADDVFVGDNVFARTTLIANSGMVYTGFDAGSTLTNWVCHDNVAKNLSSLAFGTTASATPVTDSFSTTGIKCPTIGGTGALGALQGTINLYDGNGTLVGRIPAYT